MWRTGGPFKSEAARGRPPFRKTRAWRFERPQRQNTPKMSKTFYLRPHVLAAFRAQTPPTAPDLEEEQRSVAWRAAFPNVELAVVEGTARLFSATPPETFARWLAIRSAITPEDEAKEKILQDEPERATLFPLHDKQMFEFRKTIERLHWIAQEVDLDNDGRDLKKVPAEDRRLLEHTLGFFGVADELVMEGIDEVLSKLLRRKEGQFYLRAQNDQECVHSEAYSLQIQEIVPAERRSAVFNAVRTHPVVALMADWVRWWILAEHPAADVFIVMAFLEGVLFSGFFATLQHYKLQNLFPGVTSLNEFIARDEGVHTLFWCFILKERLRRRPDASTANAVARETVALSEAFFKNAIPSAIIGLNAGLLSQYVRYVANTVLVLAGYQPSFQEDSSPFSFMDMLALNEVAKSNFFEYRVSAYQNIGGADGSLAFELNETPVEGGE
ncbi:ribonucleoside-diphosphate reductase small chain [Elysia marginata]|uniref:Ribonucleoside-diphosphate reductase small chain n=1 Tax=Elysia marginata TaxID=1093978 RepID=A0AAV4H4H7_9GAST|nr:ribonucleoside-diphosphate reductase small chain [Elysia marginata]